jgi:uncharacterized protein YbbK (DUF523 family)
MNKILVSACLLGENCTYKGGNNRNPAVEEYVSRYEYILFCPEVVGGMPIPRPPCELPRGRADTVLAGTEKIFDRNGQDVSQQVLIGAEQACALCRQHHIRVAVLREGSPSCGVHRVHDGSFSGRVIPGSGITATRLRQEGVTVISEEDISADR